MDERLLQLLHEQGFGDLETKLRAAASLSDGDLLAAGLTLVQVRRLQRLARRATADLALAAAAAAPEEESEEDAEAEAPKAVAFGHRKTEPAKPAGWCATPAIRRQPRKKTEFWQAQVRGRPARVIFIRHGESEANVQRQITQTVPDHSLHLTRNGRDQALAAGERLKGLCGKSPIKFIHSPYTRTRETLNGILHAWGEEKFIHLVSEEVRIREQEYGNFDSPEIREMHKEKKVFGQFYYRFGNGESLADCYNRASLFLESMYRSWQDNTHDTHVIVGHGVMILVTLMRIFRIPVREFAELDALKNTEFVVLERPVDDAKYQVSYVWPPGEEPDHGGLRKADSKNAFDVPIWDGSPDAPCLHSEARRESRWTKVRGSLLGGQLGGLHSEDPAAKHRSSCGLSDISSAVSSAA